MMESFKPILNLNRFYPILSEMSINAHRRGAEDTEIAQRLESRSSLRAASASSAPLR
jgi:hypothetical protein